jgi:hypothetical protein
MPCPSAGAVLFAEALGVGVGVVVAEAMPAIPRPAPTARAVAERPRVILFVRDMYCLLDLPCRDGCSW